MFDWLVRIPGPDFLAGFILLSVVCIIIGRKMVRGSVDEAFLPDKNQLDPLAFAVLRGGWKAAVDITVLQLIERDIVDFADDAGGKTLYIKNHTEGLSPVEQVIYNYLSVPKNHSQFNGKELQTAMESALQPVYQQLQTMRLVKSADDVSTGKQITYFLLIFLDGLALTKLYFGLMYHKSVVFLMLLIPAVSLALLFVIRPWEKVTSLGNRYLQDVTKHFAWLQAELSANNSSSSAMNVVLGAAIFGMGILAYSQMFSPYQVFAQSNRLGNNSLSSTSSMFGSDSGSSDGGGSGCGGGGCGGCGGSS